jgi:hypothetical protein
MPPLRNAGRFSSLLLVSFTLMLVYVFLDLQTSRNTTGQVGLDRSGVHLAIFALLAVLGIYYAFTTARGRILRSPVKGALLLIAGWISLSTLFRSTIMWSAAVQIGLSLLWVVVYHLMSYYLRSHPDSWHQIRRGVLLLFLFYLFYALYGAYTIGRAYNRIPVVNAAYSVLVFLPWLSLVTGRKLRRWVFTATCFVVMFAMKRGAIIALPLMLLSSAFVRRAARGRQIASIVPKTVFLALLFLAGLWGADRLSGGFLSERFSLEQLVGGSGRLEMYKTLVRELSTASPSELLLGRGSGSVEQLLGMAAHNDWLEFLFSYGIVGAGLYAFLILALVQRWRRLVRASSPYAAGYAMAVTYVVVVGMYGMIYFAHSTLLIMMFFGAVEGLLFNDESARQRTLEARDGVYEGKPSHRA